MSSFVKTSIFRLVNKPKECEYLDRPSILVHTSTDAHHFFTPLPPGSPNSPKSRYGPSPSSSAGAHLSHEPSISTHGCNSQFYACYDTRNRTRPTFEGHSLSSSYRSLPFSQVHGFLQAIVWAIIFPAGIISARFFRHVDPLWWHLHRAFQGVGFIVFVIALGLGLKAKARQGGGSGVHAALAVVLLVAVILQVGSSRSYLERSLS